MQIDPILSDLRNDQRLSLGINLNTFGLKFSLSSTSQGKERIPTMVLMPTLYKQTVDHSLCSRSMPG